MTVLNARQTIVLREPVVLYFTMVRKACGEWVRVGTPFRTKEAAKSWLQFIQNAWIGHRVSVRSCKVTFASDGKPDEKSKRRIDHEFNIDLG